MQSKPNADYLKYWRVVRYYVKAKYKLTTPDLEMLLFLYSEKYFGRGDFKSYSELMSWDKNRWERLRQEGWIQKFREPSYRLKQKALYKLSYKAQKVIASIYEQLSGNRDMSVDRRRNPMGESDVCYNHKVYRNQIKKINEEYKRLRRGED